MNKDNSKKSGLHISLNKKTRNISLTGNSKNNLGLHSDVEVLETPVKSFSDKKDYRVIRLKNGLTACLISDTSQQPDKNLSGTESESGTDSDVDTTSSWESDSGSSSGADENISNKSRKGQDEVKLAAAALCVGVGSFSDPKEVPGLAHFLEHMVFMGSKKFPKENDFDAFIKKHGGSDNASTENETTTFYFECFEQHLSQALDKFAQFFISPLMKKDSLSRERESVESEFQMAVPSDDNRVEQLLMSLAHKSSPVNSFCWGNLVSLRDNISDDVLYEKLHEFRKRHYSAHRMTVAIQARFPLDVLESFVVNCFSDVPNNNLDPEDFSNYSDEVFHTSEFNRIYYVKPIKDTCQVILTWVMPSMLQLYKSKPYDYVSWLLGHEGQGSLFSYLKKQLWAYSLVAGTGTSGADFNSIYTAFVVTILLTKEGFKNIDKVIEAVFSYIELLNNLKPSRRIFDEIQTIQDISFRFDEEENPCDIVEELVENMQLYPPEDYLTGSELFFEYEPEEIEKLMKYLTPSNVNIMILSTEIPDSVIYNKTEPWFKTQYTDQEIPKDWLERWRMVEPLPYFMLPEPNEFLTQDFSILPVEYDIPQYPQKIMDTPQIELWYKKDQKFELPVAYYYYYLFSSFSVESAKNTCMLQIFVLILNMNLMEEGYPAKLADLSYTISSWERGILIKVGGFNEKLPKLVQLIAKYLKNCPDSFDETLFETARTKQQQNVYNVLLRPSKLCNDVRSDILQAQYISLLEKYLAFPTITYDMMKEFSANVLSCLYIQGLIQGNLTQTTALSCTESLLEELNFTPLPSLGCLKVPVNELPRGERCCRLFSINKENINSVVTNYYQCGPLNIKDNVILDFIMLLIEEPLFDTLRTKEQLGYSIFSTIRDTYGILGYSITVQTQADKYPTRYIDNRIENFIKVAQGLLKKMTNKKFNQTKQALIKVKQVVDVDLEDEVDRNWEEIIYCKYMFDRLQQEVDAIQKLKIGEIVKWWDLYNIYNKKNNCRKLTVQVMGHIKSSIMEAIEIGENPTQLEVTELPTGLIDERDLAKMGVTDYTLVKLDSEEISTEHVVLRDDLEMTPMSDTFNKNTVDAIRGSTVQHNLALDLIDDKSEIIEQGKADNYFIKDIKEFKKTLQSFPQSTIS